MTRSKQNLYGQTIGNKGRLTRDRILKATAELMERRTLRELKVAEIGAAAGTSTSAFYLYFDGVTAAALAVVEALHQDTPELMGILERDWTTDTLFDNAKAFVSSYFTYWQRHHAPLRLRNFAADEGDRRFFEARRVATEPIHFALQEKMRAFQKSTPGSLRLHPPSTVSVLLAMMERTASILRLPSAHKATRSRQIESAAFLVASAMMPILPATVPASTAREAPARV
jgi:AcrR family transcriptional regulator